MSEAGLSSEEMWLQDSEARLESMEILLKSVRRDIDALSKKLPSPRLDTHMAFRQEEPVVHETGNRTYALQIDKRPKGYQNLGLGSHTTLEPFDVEDDTERPANNAYPQKTWRSPADFRSKGSPPDSPAFGESSSIISLNDIILHNASTPLNVEEVEPLGSQHSLPTIEENSQEDNTDSSSISTAEDLKTADYSFRQRLASAVSCTTSSDAIADLLRLGLTYNTMSKCSLDDFQSTIPEQAKCAPFSFGKSPSHGSSIVDSESLRYSCTSLRSIISDTDSFVTVNSRYSPSGEEAYVTACSDNDGLCDSSNEGRKMVLVLQQNLSPECQCQSEDVLEFTLVEATTCRTPVPRKKTSAFETIEEPTELSGDSVKKSTKRRALRKLRPENLLRDCDEESDTSSASGCNEGAYDTVTSNLMDPKTSYCDEDALTIPPVKSLCTKDPSYLLRSIDSPSEEEDIVIHYADDATEIVSTTMGDRVRHEARQVDSPELILTHSDDSMPAGSNEKCMKCTEAFEIDKDGSNNKEFTSSIPADDCNGLTLFASQTDRNLNADYPKSFPLPIVVPQIDLPDQHINRLDFLSDPKLSNTLFKDDTEGHLFYPTSLQNESFDLPSTLTQRNLTQSVFKPTENTNANFQPIVGGSGGNKVRNSGGMYSRSCSRYRSTDIDVALATATSGDNIVGSSLNYNGKSRRMASSLFDLSVRRQLSMSNNLQFSYGKSNNSLLETDIDTGEQIILETDVDTLDTYQLIGGSAEANEGSIQPTKEKTCSLFNLACPNGIIYHERCLVEENKHKSGPETYKRVEVVSGTVKSIDNQRSQPKSCFSSLVARLRSRARSNHELRVAESLTRIHVPEWFDKADLLRPVSPSRRTASPSPTRERSALPRYGASLSSPTVMQDLLVKEIETKPPMSKTIEPVFNSALPLTPLSNNQPRRSLRPSQILRERNASSGPRLIPIKSFLKSSMKCQIGEGVKHSPVDSLPMPQIITPVSTLCPAHVTSEDGMFRSEGSNAQVFPPNDLMEAPMTLPYCAYSLPQPTSLQETQFERPNRKAPFFDSNGFGGCNNVADNRFHKLGETIESKHSVNSFIGSDIFKKVQSGTNTLPIHLSKRSLRNSPARNVATVTNPLSSTWKHADLDEETEADATEGLNNIQDLTCLTNILDKYYTRHLTLLQNRPSALENISTQFGWCSNMDSSQLPLGSEYYVALAASHFNPDEDSHRNEFFTLLKSLADRGPMILTKYGFDRERCGLHGNPKDGMFYLHCSNSSCLRMGPTRVDRVRSWRTCTNCFTAYCSPECREQAVSGHNEVCDFGRVRLVCGRILHHLTSSQQMSLAALAKAGGTRLGRGGILITFASVQEAEFFLAKEQSLQKPKNVATDRSSPSGLIAPPAYLTVEEFTELDSKLATPCMLYKPSVSYVLTVIICAYDVKMTKNGQAVHLYKQYNILPFPVTVSTAATRTSEIKSPSSNAASVSRMHQQTTKEEREAYSKRLQRTLRERGVSLRNSEPEVYRLLSTFVKTGEPFKPVTFDLNDYYSNQVITCMIAPMKDAEIRQKRDCDANVIHSTYHTKKPHRTSRSRILETDF